MTEQETGMTPLTLIPLFECGCGTDPDCTHGPTELLLYPEEHVMAAHEDSDSDEGFYYALGQPRATFYDRDMAAYIVQAANAYPALVAAVRAVLDEQRYGSPGEIISPELEQQLKAALDAAKEER